MSGGMSQVATLALSQTVYVAIMHPVRSAKPTARRAPARCEAKGLPVRTSAEMPISTAPINAVGDRKSTRLNSSHSQISYAVFCLKKKKKNRLQPELTKQ